MTPPTMTPTFGDDLFAWLSFCWPSPVGALVADDGNPGRVELIGNEPVEEIGVFVWVNTLFGLVEIDDGEPNPPMLSDSVIVVGTCASLSG